MADLIGTVIDSEGTPIVGAIVSVYSKGDLRGQDFTGPQGDYTIKRLPRTVLEIKVTIDNEDRYVESIQLDAPTVERTIQIQTEPTTTTVAPTFPHGGTTMTTTSSTTTTSTATTGTTTTGTTSTGPAPAASPTTGPAPAASPTTGPAPAASPTTGPAPAASPTTGPAPAASPTTGPAPAASTATVTVPPVKFTNLLGTIAGIGLHPPVNIAEAIEFRRLYTVANYVAAGVPSAVRALDDMLTSGATVGPTLINKSGLLASTEGQKINSTLKIMAEDHNNEQKLMSEARAQFDLGTEPAETVNADFKVDFIEFVGMCADELMAFDPLDDRVKGNPLITPERLEEAYSFMRSTKRALIRVMESMSRSGRLGTGPLVVKWAEIVDDSVKLMQKVGTAHVATDDADLKHPWSVMTSLNGRARSEIDSYLVHAKEAADLLDATIEVYQDMQTNKTDLADEGPDLLRRLFHTTQYMSFPNLRSPGNLLTVSERLHREATLILENWIPEWSA